MRRGSRAEREWRAAIELADRLSLIHTALLGRFRLIFVLRMRGDVVECRRLVAQARPLAEVSGGLALLTLHVIAAKVECAAGARPAAIAALREATGLARGRFGGAWEISEIALPVAVQLGDEGRFDDAARAIGLARGGARDPADRPVHSILAHREQLALVDRLTSTLGGDRLSELMAEGAAMTVGEAVALLERDS